MGDEVSTPNERGEQQEHAAKTAGAAGARLKLDRRTPASAALQR
jgi:hypothetical protein